MLARVNRLVSGEEFRLTSRQGRRTETNHMVVMSLTTNKDHPARFGFTVTRKIGNAVNRNKLRRRLRAIAWELVRDGVVGVDVAVRGLPGSTVADWDTLHTQLFTAVLNEKGGGR